VQDLGSPITAAMFTTPHRHGPQGMNKIVRTST
jgi:hypothetical protein